MAVPTAPTAGEPIAEAWGDVVHDAVVANDIQSGVVNITVTAGTQATAVVTFTRPFAGTPVVVALIGPQGSGAALSWVVQIPAGGVSATAVSLRISGSTAQSFTLPVQWIAYGPRA